MTDPIEELRRVLEETTPGEWANPPGTVYVEYPDRTREILRFSSTARLAVLAHNHLPELLRRLETAEQHKGAKQQTIMRMGRLLAKNGLVSTDGPDAVEQERDTLRDQLTEARAECERLRREKRRPLSTCEQIRDLLDSDD